MSNPQFDADQFPGRPKILFIGIAGSSHTISWIDLLSQARMNVRLFAVPDSGFPPPDWHVRTYLTASRLPGDLDSRWRSCSYFTPEDERTEVLCQTSKTSRASRILYHLNYKIEIKPCESELVINIMNSLRGIFASLIIALIKGLGLFQTGRTLFSSGKEPIPEQYLARVIREWRPDIIHTLGLTHQQGGLYYHQIRRKYDLAGLGLWILQLRGGSDLTLNRHDPSIAPLLASAMKDCDQIISDNIVNIDYAKKMGVPRGKFASISPVPGTGGIDIEAIRKTWTLLPSKRERFILWPKAYDCEWTVALPVFEALKMAWTRIKPCRIMMLWMTTEMTKMWFKALPEEILESTQVFERIPRHEVLDCMVRARVILAPSLVDGIPNTLYEAMACGAFPIVAPLETIKTVVEEKKNVLFARNLYPEEIAAALVRAMQDDFLVDQAARNNLELVHRTADRKKISQKVIAYYESIAAGSKLER